MPVSPTHGEGAGILSVKLECNGKEIPTYVQLQSVNVKKALNKVPSAEIVIIDGNMATHTFPNSDDSQFVPGTKVVVKAGFGSNDEKIFEGIIVKHSLKIENSNQATLTLECRDKAMAMTLARKNAKYVDQADSDIIGKLISAYGLTSDVASTTPVHKELVQYYASDWDFMMSRAELNGLVINVDAGKVTVKAPEVSAAAELRVVYGNDLIEFQAEIDARHQVKKVDAVSWDVKTQALIRADAGPATVNEQGNLSLSELAKVFALDEYRLQVGSLQDKEVLTAWAKSRQLRTGLSRIQGRMKFQGSDLAVPGSIIELEGVGARFSGKVYVSAVQHELSAGSWVTEAQFGLPPESFAERRDLVSPPVSGLLPGIEGLQIGVVKKLDADPGTEFRIQVSLPLLEAEKDEYWARLASPYASKEFGAYFIPEIGDEVLIGFLNGDPSNPVILGSLYSSQHKMAFPLAAENNVKAFTTRTKMEIHFDEEKKVITVKTPGSNKIVISDEGKSISLLDQTGNKLVLSDVGISLDSPKDIVISAKGKVEMSGVGGVVIESKADVKIDGTNVAATAKVGATVKGNATAEMSASGQTTIKGAMVMIN